MARDSIEETFNSAYALASHLEPLDRLYGSVTRQELRHMELTTSSAWQLHQKLLDRDQEMARITAGYSSVSAYRDALANITKEFDLAARARSALTRELDAMGRAKAGALSVYDFSDGVADTLRRFAEDQQSALQQANHFSDTVGRVELARSKMDEFAARFSLPDRIQTERLFATYFDNPAADACRLFTAQHSQIQQAAELMRSAWLDRENALASIGGFMALQDIGQSLKSSAPFDDLAASALREHLGDWREPISWSAQVFTDPAARLNLYLDRGFNPGIANFPSAAFTESLDIAGFNLDGSLIDDEDEVDTDEACFARGDEALGSIFRMEVYLRRFIETNMSEGFGSDWPYERVPPKMLNKWLKKKTKREQDGGPERPLIEYADLSDYAELICTGDNWSLVFECHFRRPESVWESFRRLYPHRPDVAHSRFITQEDLLYIKAEVWRIMKVVRQ